jgi:hypothetical protein
MPEQLRDVQKISSAAAKIENALGPQQIEFNFANAAHVNVDPALEVEIFRPVFAGICDSVTLADLLKIRPINLSITGWFRLGTGFDGKTIAYVFLR